MYSPGVSIIPPFVMADLIIDPSGEKYYLGYESVIQQLEQSLPKGLRAKRCILGSVDIEKEGDVIRLRIYYVTFPVRITDLKGSHVSLRLNAKGNLPIGMPLQVTYSVLEMTHTKRNASVKPITDPLQYPAIGMVILKGRQPISYSFFYKL